MLLLQVEGLTKEAQYNGTQHPAKVKGEILRILFPNTASTPANLRLSPLSFNLPGQHRTSDPIQRVLIENDI